MRSWEDSCACVLLTLPCCSISGRCCTRAGVGAGGRGQGGRTVCCLVPPLPPGTLPSRPADTLSPPAARPADALCPPTARQSPCACWAMRQAGAWGQAVWSGTQLPPCHPENGHHLEALGHGGDLGNSASQSPGLCRQHSSMPCFWGFVLG